LREFAKDPAAAKHKGYAEKVRAQFGDEELLKSLTDGSRDSRDPAVVELLKIYGETGRRRAAEAVEGGKLDRRVGDQLVAQTRDEAHVPKLIEKYRKTKDPETKDSILEALIAVGNRECQALFRELLDAKDPQLKHQFQMETRLMWSVWAYDEKESRRFEERALTMMQGNDPVNKTYAIEMAVRFREDRDFEVRAALLMVAVLRDDMCGRDAAKALQTLTGQRFQYAKPRFGGDENMEARVLGITEERVALYEKEYPGRS
jgi:hypothetical protein